MFNFKNLLGNASWFTGTNYVMEVRYMDAVTVVGTDIILKDWARFTNSTTGTFSTNLYAGRYAVKLILTKNTDSDFQILVPDTNVTVQASSIIVTATNATGNGSVAYSIASANATFLARNSGHGLNISSTNRFTIYDDGANQPSLFVAGMQVLQSAPLGSQQMYAFGGATDTVFKADGYGVAHMNPNGLFPGHEFGSVYSAALGSAAEPFTSVYAGHLYGDGSGLTGISGGGGGMATNGGSGTGNVFTAATLLGTVTSTNLDARMFALALANSNLSYALGVNGTNQGLSLALACSNLSYAIGAAGTNNVNGAGTSSTNFALGLAQVCSNLSYALSLNLTNRIIALEAGWILGSNDVANLKTLQQNNIPGTGLTTSTNFGTNVTWTATGTAGALTNNDSRPIQFTNALYDISAMLGFWGDSITVGQGASNNAQGYAAILATNMLGLTSTNRGLGSAEMANINIRISSNAIPAVNVILPGINNAKHLGDSPQALSQYEAELYYAVLTLAVPRTLRPYATTNYTAISGIWTTNLTLGRPLIGTSTNGSLTYTVQGDALYVASLIVSNGNNAYGSFNVTIDGVLVTNLENELLFTNSFAFPAGQWSVVRRFGGLTNGIHSVTLSNTVNGKFTFLEYVLGNAGLNGPDNTNSVYVGSTIRCGTGTNGYASGGVANYQHATNSTIDAYNIVSKRVCGKLISDGLNVTYVDVNQYYNPDAIPLQTQDGTHPTNSGHIKIAEAFYRAMDQKVRPQRSGASEFSRQLAGVVNVGRGVLTVDGMLGANQILLLPSSVPLLAAPQAPFQSYFWNSNGTVYILTSGAGITTWASTNKIAP